MFAIDVTVAKGSNEWQDTIDLLTAMAEYGTPPGSEFSVVLIGDDNNSDEEFTALNRTGVIEFLRNNLPSNRGKNQQRNCKMNQLCCELEVQSWPFPFISKTGALFLCGRLTISQKIL